MINNRFKRLLSMLMCVVMFVTSPCTSVFAYTDNCEEEIFEADTAEEWDSFPEDEFSNEDLFEGYMLKEAEAIVNDSDEEIQEDESGVYVERGALLAGNDKLCYDFLKEKCKRVVAGKISYTRFYIPLPDSLRIEYTAEMLGVSSLYESGSVTAEAKAAMNDILTIDYKKVVRSLMMDMPYELYWFDKVKGYGFFRDVEIKYKSVDGVEYLSYSKPGDFDEPCWRISFFVSSNYSVSGKQETYDFNTTLAVKAGESAARAAEDVVRVAESVSSDYAKLNAYKTLIQGYSQYNNAALTSGTPYGDPWQMIHVFDGDPSTKVVCEGFSKAFKFLCDLSSFAGDVNCYLVSGFLTSSSGQHMWNNVLMEDGKSYLVDITNSRADNARNFMGGAEYRTDKSLSIPKKSNGDPAYTTYSYYCEYNYYYDYLTMSLYDDDVLVYNTSAYDLSSARTTCNVTLSMNYAEGGKKLISVYQNEDAKAKLLAETPVRKGYAFEGWYALSENRVYLEDLSHVTVSDNSCVFCAKWRELDKYPVTAHSGKGTFADSSVSRTEQMYEGQPYYEAFEIPVLEHYDFTGWYKNESCSANQLIEEEELFDTGKGSDIYAGWKLKRYKLTLFPNGGEFADGSTKGKAITYNALSRLKDPSKYTPLRAGYDFVGWFTAKEGGEEYDIAQAITRDVTLYAQWKLKEVVPDSDNDPVTPDIEPSTPSGNEADKPEDKDSVSVNGFYASFYADCMYKDANGLWHAVYSGEKLTPEVRVYDNRKLLTEGVDYSLKYVNNLKAFEMSGRTAYAVIKGKGNMIGSYRLDFVIDRADLKYVTVGNLCVKEGYEAKADPTLVYKGRKLKKNNDYSCEAKEGSVSFRGIGNYCGEISGNLIVQSAGDYKTNTIKVKLDLPELVYDGKEKKLKNGSELIVSDKNGRNASYTVSYSSNINAGTVKMIICGTGEYHGVVKKSFRIKPCKVKGTDAFDISYKREVTYQRGGAKPEDISIKCKATGEVLKEGKDIKYSYSKYKKCGTAKIKLTFKGNYKGSSYPVLEYKINKQSLQNARVYAGDIAYIKPGKYKPKVVVTLGSSLVDVKEYRMVYPYKDKIEGPVAGLELSVSSKEKNYEKIEISASYNIVSKGIDVNKAKIVYNKGADKQDYEGRDEDVTLIPGKDFRIKVSKEIVIDDEAEIERNFNIIYTDNDRKGTAYMILVPKNDKYAGVIISKFTIRAAEIKSLVK
ncbi:MAG: InlB B-repeat-containing protein [Lachnospiraceae bacterium]|nr:InlB B-repeat-containing protein [Lachnospiraceae bacterium]